MHVSLRTRQGKIEVFHKLLLALTLSVSCSPTGESQTCYHRIHADILPLCRCAMVCHDAWFFGMHMLFHKVRRNTPLLQQPKPCPVQTS